jgi:hypothetical protein
VSTTPTVGWLAGGRIHLREASGTERTIESRFGGTVVERALQIQRRHAWKDQGRGAQFRGMLWSGPQGAAHPGLAITSLTRGERAGELLYALETREIAGVFAVTADGAEERRLFHGNDRRVRFLASRPGSGHILCSLYREGTASVAMMNGDGNDLTELTEGDSLDLAPSFEQGTTRRIVFQSAGVARTREGQAVGVGPFAIRRLDLDRGEVDTVAEDEGFDFLGPRGLADGTTIAIRRPHTGRGGASFWASTKDFLLFPARLLYALFQYLNFFSARYAGKPLTTAGGPKQETDARQMMVWGNLMEATSQEEGDDDTPAVVASSWTLVRLHADGRTDTLARGVLAFDVASDGTVVYTNGNGIYRLGAGGKKDRIASGSGIEQVVVLD